MRVFAFLVAVLSLGLAAALSFAHSRWRSRTTDLIAQLHRSSAPSTSAAFSAAEIGGLPQPVTRYFRTVLPEGQPVVRSLRLIQQGDFLLRPSEDGWRPFRAVQHVVTQPAGFVWDARIRMAPGISVSVRDAFVNGNGYMHASLMGIIRLVSVEETPEIAAGALHRYLAEAVWIPTALLPSQGVRWSAIDASSARATLSVAGIAVSLDFRFTADGLVESIFTPARARDVEGRAVPTPWQGRFFDYAVRGGMRIPLRGEVEWLLPEGPKVYWRGRITQIDPVAVT
jgi:hypothetical protein